MGSKNFSNNNNNNNFKFIYSQKNSQVKSPLRMTKLLRIKNESTKVYSK